MVEARTHEELVAELEEAFAASVMHNETWGPNGKPMRVHGEEWRVGMSPGYSYFATNLGQGVEVSVIRDYHLYGLSLTKATKATFRGSGHWVESTEPVTSEEEVVWLVALLQASLEGEPKDPVDFNLPFPE